MRLLAIFWVVIVGCAEIKVDPNVNSDGGGKTVDAASTLDGSPDAPISPIDAPVVVDSPPVDAPIPVDAAVVCNDVNLLNNSDFDLGASPDWIQSSNIITDVSNVPIAPQTGNYLAWLGGWLSSTDSIYQQIIVPANTTNLQLTGVSWIASEELDLVAFDNSVIQLESSTGASILEQIVGYDNTHQGTSWVPFSETIVGNYAGQTIRFTIGSNTDSTNNTNFWYDSLALTATVCQ